MTSTLHWLDGPMAVPKITDRAKVVRMDPRTKSLTRACSRRSVMDRSASQQDVTHVLGRHRTRSNCTPDCNLLARQAPLPSGPVMAQEAEGFVQWPLPAFGATACLASIWPPRATAAVLHSLFRPDIFQVGLDRASVLRGRRSTLTAVGR